ncbi:MAG: NADP(H)-dependent aldo-keto reductase [Rhodospirillaceae bacterium]|nr:MAG: NADP(H)-dependent aldo-keto reductase [Rhodospirillaceae bacterium]
MEKRKLGRSDIQVSCICLGTMTWGEQNTESEAHAQLDLALDRGVNFIDTAEMYPILPRAETCGRTETYIGNWLKARKNRDKVVLATKVVGQSRFSYIRGGKHCLDRSNIEAAIDASLRRLRTDYIDLYQLHWPDRSTNIFGTLGYSHVEEESVPLEETLAVLEGLVRAGKIRAIGISNETPWGAMRYLHLAEMKGWARMASIQNPFNLLNRSFEVGLAEIAIREDCGLLAYSPLAFGVLSGKYLDGRKPAGARLTLFSEFTRYSNLRAQAATEAYVRLAEGHGLDPAQMALAYVIGRPFVTSAIVGATTMAQLQSNLASAAMSLSSEVLQAIDAIHSQNPNPSP